MVKQEPEQDQGEGESSFGGFCSHPGKDSQPASPLGHKTRGVTLRHSAAGTMPLSAFWHHTAQARLRHWEQAKAAAPVSGEEF